MTRENQNKARTILRSARIGIIVCEIAKRLGIVASDALKKFYQSKTCRDFHNRNTGLYLQGDLYIVNEFLMETTFNNGNNDVNNKQENKD